MTKRNKRKNAKTDTGNNRSQTFSFAAPTAMRVQSVGDFTQWQQKPVSMQKDEDGIWRTTVALDPGTHHYQFLVDGQWREDPECALHVPNPYGGRDAVRQVA